MGINSLHKVLGPVTERKVPVSRFEGKKVAVDISSWLYKGAYGCANQLCEGRETDGYVRYVMQKVDLLKFNNIKPIMVFDGNAVPLKAETQADRRKGRLAALEEARRLMQQMRCTNSPDQRQMLFTKAQDHYQQAFSVTKQMTHTMIEALKDAGIEYVVAPFEADAQIAALIQTGRADAAISEDSDLLVYSVVIQKPYPVLYKMDREGYGDLIIVDGGKGDRGDFGVMVKQIKSPRSSGAKASKKEGEFVRKLSEMSRVMFVQMCVLGGCDYLQHIEGVGIHTAQKMLLRLRSQPDADRIKSAVKYFLCGGLIGARKHPVPACGQQEYVARANKAVAVFYHQQVFDMRPTVHHVVSGVTEGPVCSIFAGGQRRAGASGSAGQYCRQRFLMSPRTKGRSDSSSSTGNGTRIGSSSSSSEGSEGSVGSSGRSRGDGFGADASKRASLKDYMSRRLQKLLRKRNAGDAAGNAVSVPVLVPAGSADEREKERQPTAAAVATVDLTDEGSASIATDGNGTTALHAADGKKQEQAQKMPQEPQEQQTCKHPCNGSACQDGEAVEAGGTGHTSIEAPAEAAPTKVRTDDGNGGSDGRNGSDKGDRSRTMAVAAASGGGRKRKRRGGDKAKGSRHFLDDSDDDHDSADDNDSDFELEEVEAGKKAKSGRKGRSRRGVGVGGGGGGAAAAAAAAAAAMSDGDSAKAEDISDEVEEARSSKGKEKGKGKDEGNKGKGDDEDEDSATATPKPKGKGKGKPIPGQRSIASLFAGVPKSASKFKAKARPTKPRMKVAGRDKGQPKRAQAISLDDTDDDVIEEFGEEEERGEDGAEVEVEEFEDEDEEEEEGGGGNMSNNSSSMLLFDLEGSMLEAIVGARVPDDGGAEQEAAIRERATGQSLVQSLSAHEQERLRAKRQRREREGIHRRPAGSFSFDPSKAVSQRAPGCWEGVGDGDADGDGSSAGSGGGHRNSRVFRPGQQRKRSAKAEAPLRLKPSQESIASASAAAVQELLDDFHVDSVSDDIGSMIAQFGEQYSCSMVGGGSGAIADGFMPPPPPAAALAAPAAAAAAAAAAPAAAPAAPAAASAAGAPALDSPDRDDDGDEMLEVSGSKRRACLGVPQGHSGGSSGGSFSSPAKVNPFKRANPEASAMGRLERRQRQQQQQQGLGHLQRQHRRMGVSMGGISTGGDSGGSGGSGKQVWGATKSGGGSISLFSGQREEDLRDSSRNNKRSDSGSSDTNTNMAGLDAVGSVSSMYFCGAGGSIGVQNHGSFGRVDDLGGGMGINSTARGASRGNGSMGMAMGLLGKSGSSLRVIGGGGELSSGKTGHNRDHKSGRPSIHSAGSSSSSGGVGSFQRQELLMTPGDALKHKRKRACVIDDDDSDEDEKRANGSSNATISPAYRSQRGPNMQGGGGRIGGSTSLIAPKAGRSYIGISSAIGRKSQATLQPVKGAAASVWAARPLLMPTAGKNAKKSATIGSFFAKKAKTR